MNTTFHIFNELSDSMQHEIAQHISDYTYGKLGEKPQMLAVKPEDIMKKFLGIVALQTATFAGYIGALEPETHNTQSMLEVGSLYVPATHRKQGIAHGLITTISKQLDANGHTPYAFCNPDSILIFNEEGYENAEAGEVPESAFGLCGTMDSCKLKTKSDLCCDTIVIHKGASS